MEKNDTTAPIVSMFACLSDNYGYLIHDPVSQETACIDTPDAEAILKQAGDLGWKITQIWNTHWHPDHAGGNEAIKAVTGCKIYGPEEVRARLNAPLDEIVGEGDILKLGEHDVTILETPGHTLGHIIYNLPEHKIAFVGDTLFALGCGRLFEGDAAMMWSSMTKLKSLPGDTTVYCAHEYTESNLAFALSVDGDNPKLQSYGERVRDLRSRGEPTVPSRLADELAANPFLRADAPDMQARMGHAGDPVATFAALRSGKDNF